jgi:hypothetical protein
MNKAFSAAAASLVTFVTLSPLAWSRESGINSIYSDPPFDKSQPHCRYEIPHEGDEVHVLLSKKYEGELSLDEIARTFSTYMAFGGDERKYTYLWYDSPSNPAVIVNDPEEFVQVYIQSDIGGSSQTIDRILREDEVFTVPESAFNGALITFFPRNGEISISLADGREESGVVLRQNGYLHGISDGVNFPALNMSARIDSSQFKDNGFYRVRIRENHTEIDRNDSNFRLDDYRRGVYGDVLELFFDKSGLYASFTQSIAYEKPEKKDFIGLICDTGDTPHRVPFMNDRKYYIPPALESD